MDLRDDADREELARLRALAFGKGGSDADVAAFLRAAERRRSADRATGDPAAAVVRSDPPPRVRRPRLVAGVAVLTGVGLLAAGLAAGAALGRDPRPRPALGVFQEPPDLAVPVSRYASRISSGTPEGIQADRRVRWLRAVPEGQLFAVLGTISRQGGTETRLAVCLVLERDGSGLIKCSPIDEFAAAGLRLRSGELDVRWGPTDAEATVLDAAGLPV